MQFKLFDWLEIVSGKTAHSIHARVIMAKYIVVHTNKRIHERLGKFVNEHYATSKKHPTDVKDDSLKYQHAIDSFFEVLNNPKHIFHFACDKILAFFLKISSRIDETCHNQVLAHTQNLWNDFLVKRKPRNYVHIFASILQNHNLAAAVIFDTPINKSVIREFSRYESKLLLKHIHRIINQLSNCTNIIV